MKDIWSLILPLVDPDVYRLVSKTWKERIEKMNPPGCKYYHAKALRLIGDGNAVICIEPSIDIDPLIAILNGSNSLVVCNTLAEAKKWKGTSYRKMKAGKVYDTLIFTDCKILLNSSNKAYKVALTICSERTLCIHRELEVNWTPDDLFGGPYKSIIIKRAKRNKKIYYESRCNDQAILALGGVYDIDYPLKILKYLVVDDRIDEYRSIIYMGPTAIVHYANIIYIYVSISLAALLLNTAGYLSY